MRPDLFGNVVRPSITIGRRTWHTLPCSILMHALLVAAVVAAPLMAPGVLPLPPAMMAFRAAAPLPPPPPPPRARTAAPKALVDTTRAVPIEAPSGIKPDAGLVAPDEGPPEGVERGVPGSLPGSGLAVSPEPTPPPPPATTAPVRPGGDLRSPTRIKNVQPMYPAIAQAARVQGTVIVEAIIGTDGKVRDARVLRSIPLLDQAALDAVRQWEYTPSRLNGVPVPVLMTVTVTFTLR